MNKKAIIAAGGTGGHIIPAIAIGKEMKKNGIEVLFVGNKNSMESRLVKDFDFVAIDVQKLYRKFTYKHIFFPYKFIKSILDAQRIITDFKPDFFVGTGGFVSGPVGIAAILKKVPLFIQEQNSYPGITNRVLGVFAENVFIAYEICAKYFKKSKTELAGNPVNPTVYEKAEIDYEKYGLKRDSFKIFLLGGSQGSRTLNKNFFPIVDKLLGENIEIIWQTGKIDFEQYKNYAKNGLYIFDFSSDMGKIYNSVDLVISRAGAITLEEIKIKKIPSILIPLSIAAGNHQFLNAFENFKNGFSEIISENKLGPENLYEKIIKIRENYQKYKERLNATETVDSAKLIAKAIIKKVYEEGR